MAKAFRFRLAAVEKIRERARTLQRRRVAEAIRAQTLVQQRIDTLYQRLNEAADATRAVCRSGFVDVPSLRLTQFQRGWLEQRIEESIKEEGERASAVEAEREVLAHATKRLRVIEKLRTRQWQRHQFETRKEERVVADEAAVEVHRRKLAHYRYRSEIKP